MARGHGRILSSVWEDHDFTEMTQAQQRFYFFLISQPNLNHAGLLPVTLKRWSKKASDLTVGGVEKLLIDLEDRRFIAVDDDTEELLIRTFVRNDGVWKQPKVMAAMVSGAAEISSMKLRRILLAEMSRLPLDELSSDPGARGMSVRQQIEEQLTNLRRTLRVPDPEPPHNPSRRVPDTPGEDFGKGSDTPGEALPKPSESLGVPTTRARGRARDARSPAPAPAPTPVPSPLPSARARADEDESAIVQTGERAIADRMTDAFLDRYRSGNAYSQRQVRKVIAEALANGTDPDELWTALERLGSLSKPVSAGTLQFAFSEIRNRKAANVVEMRPSTADARVAVGQALAAKFREEERRALEPGPAANQEPA